KSAFEKFPKAARGPDRAPRTWPPNGCSAGLPRRLLKISSEPHLHFRLVLQVYRVHKTHPRRRERHDDGLCPGPVTKETHALQQIAIGDAACGKDNLAARRQFLRGVNLLVIPNPHG